MKNRIDVLGVVLLLVALALFVAAAKTGHGASTYGFFSGG